MNNYEVLSGNPLDKCLAITVITDLCVKDLKDRLELATKDDVFGGTWRNHEFHRATPRHIRRSSSDGRG